MPECIISNCKSGMALRKILKQTGTVPTHFLVKFDEDEQICIIPAKMIASPSTSTLQVSSPCTIKWTDKKEYTAHVLAVGDLKQMREKEAEYNESEGDENSQNSANVTNRKGKKRRKKQVSAPAAKRQKAVKPPPKKKSPEKFLLEVGSPPPCDPPPAQVSNPPEETARPQSIPPVQEDWYLNEVS